MIADDHFIVREGLKQIVSDVPDMVVVHEASDGQEALIIASGHSIKKISEELFLSIKTVSTYRTKILKKMTFTNNSELIRYSIENGLGND